MVAPCFSYLKNSTETSEPPSAKVFQYVLAPDNIIVVNPAGLLPSISVIQ